MLMGDQMGCCCCADGLSDGLLVWTFASWQLGSLVGK